MSDVIMTIKADQVQPHDLRPTSTWTNADGSDTVDCKGAPVSEALFGMLAKARSQTQKDAILRGSFDIVGDGYLGADVDPSNTEPGAPAKGHATTR